MDGKLEEEEKSPAELGVKYWVCAKVLAHWAEGSLEVREIMVSKEHWDGSLKGVAVCSASAQ